MSSVLTATPGQTVGPFFGYALPFARGSELVAAGSPGAIRLHGVVRDGAGDPVPDALLEIWQPDTGGNVPDATGALRRDGWTFTGWGRASTDDEGQYTFTTVLPGATEGQEAPFISVVIFARGLLNRVFTRIYLPGAEDSLLSSLPAERAATLVAVADEHGLRFDVTLQGGPDHPETVFLDFGGSRG